MPRATTPHATLPMSWRINRGVRLRASHVRPLRRRGRIRYCEHSRRETPIDLRQIGVVNLLRLIADLVIVGKFEGHDERVGDIARGGDGIVVAAVEVIVCSVLVVRGYALH